MYVIVIDLIWVMLDFVLILEEEVVYVFVVKLVVEGGYFFEVVFWGLVVSGSVVMVVGFY